jgi:2-aminoadipate transaminase
MPAPPDFALSRKARRTPEPPITRLIAAGVGRPELISFAAGLVDYDTLPIEPVERLLPEAIDRRSLQYGTTAGDPDLRRLALARLARLDKASPEQLGLTPDDAVITTGSQQALCLISDVLLDPGDVAVVAAPSYFVFTGLLESLGADVRTVPIDAGGFRVDKLLELVDDLEAEGKLDRLKLVYCQSYHQNPTGVTLASDRRPALVEAIRAAGARAGHRVLLLEDAAYRELGVDDETPPSLKRFDPENELVASTYTFSKPFSPGLKTGIAFLPTGLREAVLGQKGGHDFGSPNLCQRILAEAMADGSYERHLTPVRQAYATRRRLMLEALARHLPDEVAWSEPAGGLYVWLRFPRGFDAGPDSTLWRECDARDVLYVPGRFCHVGSNPPGHEVRLCHATVALERIEVGVRRLGEAARVALAEYSGGAAHRCALRRSA